MLVQNKKKFMFGRAAKYQLFAGKRCLAFFLSIMLLMSIFQAVPVKAAGIKLYYFDTKIKGFGRDDAIIAAVEARTSSPIRILRNEEFLCNIEGIYPAGEGAGYSGGITSSAVDGLKIAEQIAKIYINK